MLPAPLPAPATLTLATARTAAQLSDPLASLSDAAWRPALGGATAALYERGDPAHSGVLALAGA